VVSQKAEPQMLAMMYHVRTKYLNYNKTKLEDFIDKNNADIKSKIGILDQSTLNEVTTSAKPVEKKSLDLFIHPLNGVKLAEAHGRLLAILKESATSKIIDRLTLQL